MKRLLLTSYQKTGTHQAMQMLMHDIPDIVDRSGIGLRGLKSVGFLADFHGPLPRTGETIEALRHFRGKAFGHIAYLPQYAEVVQAVPTQVIFNIRDPRDVIVSEYENMKIAPHKWPNLMMQNGKRVIDQDDPIEILIKAASIRWPNWFGWLYHEFVYVLRYEELRLRTVATVKRLREDLPNCPFPPESEMIANAQKTEWSTTFRKGLVGEWKTYFEPHHIELAKELLTPIMDVLGYEDWGV